mmetsp:Transcript_866/g.1784  ORF Transcript_866/g.1784 Transcript_866/m.1784 type:complete len:233 (-) Transcript_866:61-759(-)
MNMPELVDVIFLDIDGVLLPFGGIRDNYSKDSLSFTEGCIFPDCTMDALTTLLQRIYNISLDIAPSITKNKALCKPTIQGNPVVVLSSSWRARSEFIQDILASIRAYVGAKGLEDASTLQIWENHLESFFDITDPHFHVTRHDEIYKWVKENTTREGKQISQYSKDAARKYVVRSWIALDDEDLVNVEGIVSQDAMGHAVQTKSSVGLTLHDVDVGVHLVKKQMQDFHGIST